MVKGKDYHLLHSARSRRVIIFGVESQTKENYSPWIKIRNPQYSQWEGRHELFERERRSEPVPGWHSCELACDGVEA